MKTSVRIIIIVFMTLLTSQVPFYGLAYQKAIEEQRNYYEQQFALFDDEADKNGFESRYEYIKALLRDRDEQILEHGEAALYMVTRKQMLDNQSDLFLKSNGTDSLLLLVMGMDWQLFTLAFSYYQIELPFTLVSFGYLVAAAFLWTALMTLPRYLLPRMVAAPPETLVDEDPENSIENLRMLANTELEDEIRRQKRYTPQNQNLDQQNPAHT